jgi:4-hydroxy-tetrahydrodipicolinate synthase
MVEESLESNFERARSLYYKLLPLTKACFIETNPVPVKEALKMMGLIKSSKVRLPLVGLKQENRKRLRDVLSAYGLI